MFPSAPSPPAWFSFVSPAASQAGSSASCMNEKKKKHVIKSVTIPWKNKRVSKIFVPYNAGAYTKPSHEFTNRHSVLSEGFSTDNHSGVLYEHVARLISHSCYIRASSSSFELSRLRNRHGSITRFRVLEYSRAWQPTHTDINLLFYRGHMSTCLFTMCTKADLVVLNHNQSRCSYLII